jgi:FKBP-type peptidyl-prolyl cis-trans isomerase FkpA
MHLLVVNLGMKNMTYFMKNFLMLCVLFISTTGCIKNDQGCKNVSPASEEAQMVAFAAAKGLSVTKHSSGIYYEIKNPGTGAAPTVNSMVAITYEGKLLNGNTFDKSVDPSKSKWKLADLIEGWQIGLPLIKKGGEIKLIIPSSLAYGCNGAGSIPSNSVLYFEISLVDVQ